MSKLTYAREVLRAGRDLGISPRGIVIGFATVFVECDWIMYANAKVPESLTLPHERVGSDGKSVGLFQQQVIWGNGAWWWGDAATCMDPYTSARLFFTRLARLDYDNTAVSPGSFAQSVQRSAFPDRYDTRIGEAQRLYDELTSTPGGAVPAIDYGLTDTIFGFNPYTAGIGNSDGPRSRTDFGAVHTQQGGDGDAVGLAKYCNGTQGAAAVAYNVEVDDERTVLNVPVDEASYSAAEANDWAFHLCFAGSYAEWSTGRWLSSDVTDGLDENAMLWRGAKAMAAACVEFGIPAEYAGDNGRSGWPIKPKGLVGHKDFGRRGGGHSDPGDIDGAGFPMTEFVRRVQSFLTTPPDADLIGVAADLAKDWVGDRLTDGVIVVPGGAYAEFEYAHIYLQAGANTAYPVPHGGGLFGVWAGLGWESGPLGFPILPHAAVPGGTSQAFQGGVLLCRSAAPGTGFFVHGEIGKRYAAMGWEQGALGWPTSNEQDVAGTDNICQVFEHGTLTWSPTGVIVDLDNGGK